MDIVHKARAVEKLFKALEKDIAKLKLKTGIHCMDNCIKCCVTPKIQATALEFYPLAQHLIKEGKAESILESIVQINNPAICPILNHLSYEDSKAGCRYYEYRGLICRLFAYNYTTDKYGKRRIAACKPMQLEQANEVKTANTILMESVLGPKASNYYSRMQFIDFTASQQLYPIGEAIKIAIETILTYSHYKNSRVS